MWIHHDHAWFFVHGMFCLLSIRKKMLLSFKNLIDEREYDLMREIMLSSVSKRSPSSQRLETKQNYDQLTATGKNWSSRSTCYGNDTKQSSIRRIIRIWYCTYGQSDFSAERVKSQTSDGHYRTCHIASWISSWISSARETEHNQRKRSWWRWRWWRLIWLGWWFQKTLTSLLEQ